MKDFIGKIKSWVKEYSLFIIAILFVGFLIRGCSNDRSEKYFIYAKNKYEYTIDSLTSHIKDTRDTLYMVRAENEVLKNSIKDYRKDKEYYIKVNNNLVTVTKQLSVKRDTI